MHLYLSFHLSVLIKEDVHHAIFIFFQTEPINVVVTGAAGQIAYSLLYQLAVGTVFGPEQPINLRLLDLPMMMDSLKGVVMELEDLASPLLRGKYICRSKWSNKYTEKSNFSLIIRPFVCLFLQMFFQLLILQPLSRTQLPRFWSAQCPVRRVWSAKIC